MANTNCHVNVASEPTATEHEGRCCQACLYYRIGVEPFRYEAEEQTLVSLLLSICSSQELHQGSALLIPNRYNFGPQYQRADFEVKVIIGTADLKFQLWGKNGQLSRDHEEIEVQWYPPAHTGTTERRKVVDEFGMYNS
jgi:hypothetical protein